MAKARHGKRSERSSPRSASWGSVEDGATRFGVEPWVLYDFNRKDNRVPGRASVLATDGPEPARRSARAKQAPVALPGDVGD